LDKCASRFVPAKDFEASQRFYVEHPGPGAPPDLAEAPFGDH
jgi:hypothetical protein